MNERYLRFENPVRLAELRPHETLQKIGLKDDGVLCDIGAGTGIFTIPAAAMTKKLVYAVEISDGMLQIIQDKVDAKDIHNIKLIKSQNDRLSIDNNSVDVVLMVTVLHEISDKSVILKEVRNVLKENGTFAVIEFHKRETPMGPPVPHRISKNELIDILDHEDFALREDFDLGENFYCLVFIRKAKQ